MNNTDLFNRTVMDYIDVGTMSCYELYRLHTGHTPSDSDNDSTGSIASSSYFEENEPPLYTYEEIEANSVVIEPVSTQSRAINSDGASELVETDSVPQQIINKELAELVLSDSCILCNVKKCSNHDIEHHKMGKTHKTKVDQYIKDRLEKLQSLRLSEETYRSSTIQISSTTSSTNSTPNTKLATNAVRSRPKLDKITLQEKLLNLMCPDYCDICNADLPQPAHVVSHYYSTRHKTNCESWINAEVERFQISETSDVASWIVVPKTAKRAQAVFQNHSSESNKQISTIESAKQTEGLKNDVKPAVGGHCRLCGINVDTGLQDHYKSDLHRSSMEAFCFVCNIKTMSKQQLAEHVKGARHRKNLKENFEDLEVPQTIVTPVTKQGKSSVSLIQTKPFDEKSDKIAQVVAPPSWAVVVANSHNKETAKATVVTFYCHICKLTFGSKTDVDYHVNSFPHKIISKLMSTIVSKGISSKNIFWESTNNFQITCNLCTSRIQSESSAVGHLKSKRHLNNFSQWCSKQPKDRTDPNRRFFYCDICDLSLDGTTKAEVHYERHATKQKETINSVLKTASTSSTIVLQPGTSKADKGANTNSNKLSPAGSKNDDTEARTEELLLTETVKFIYLLKSMPASRAVHYLQKCIKELEN